MNSDAGASPSAQTWRSPGRVATRGVMVIGCCLLVAAFLSLVKGDELGLSVVYSLCIGTELLAVHRFRRRRDRQENLDARLRQRGGTRRLARLVLDGGEHRHRRNARLRGWQRNRQLADRPVETGPVQRRARRDEVGARARLRAGDPHHLLPDLARNHRHAEGRGRDGAAPGRRAAAEAARVAARAAHALQHPGQPARADRHRSAASAGDARPADRLPALFARRLAGTHAFARSRVPAPARLPGADADPDGPASRDALRPAGVARRARRCRRCCCSRWWRTASSTVSSRRSPAVASMSARPAMATALVLRVRDSGAGFDAAALRPRPLRPGARARAPGDALRRTRVVRDRRRERRRRRHAGDAPPAAADARRERRAGRS